ncbi:MAG TPA: hypothetical protein VK524_19620, partial [Polyangiaceae bacterium]|nr:hypothetical protein [Polyangiaceae bacterium]
YTPFAADDVSTVLGRVINDAPLSLAQRGIDVPADVDRVLERAMAKSPDERFADVGVFIDELARAASCSISVMPRAVALSRRATAPTSAPPAPSRKSSSPLAQTMVAPSARLDEAPAAQQVAPPADELIVSREVTHAIEQARQALGFEDVELAVRLAESALRLADQYPGPMVAEALDRAKTLFQHIYEQRLGPRHRHISVRSTPSSSAAGSMSPEHLFLLSRVDGITIDEALDISPLPRHDTLRLLLQLLQQGSIEVR